MSEKDPGEYISFDKENFDYLINQHTDSDRIEKELSEIVDHLKEARYDIGSSSFVNLPDDNNVLVQYMHQLDEEIETKGILNKEVVDRGEIRGRSISINISGSEVPQKKNKIESIAPDFGFNISEEIKDNITIYKETEGEYSDGEYPFRYDAILILLIFGKIFEQNIEPSELIQSVVSIYEELGGVVKVDDSVDATEQGDELNSDFEESREKEKTKDNERAKISFSTTSSYIDKKVDEQGNKSKGNTEASSDSKNSQTGKSDSQTKYSEKSKKEGIEQNIEDREETKLSSEIDKISSVNASSEKTRRDDGSGKRLSISSIAESARGDLDTEILKQIQSDYGLGFLEPDEQIQYIGKSTWGIRITSDEVDDRLGYENHSLITDRGIRLIIKGGDDLIDDIIIGYDAVKKTEYNSGMTKDSITVHTNEDLTLDVSELNINFQREVSDKQTKEPTIESPAIKFRLRASVQSGTSADDIVSYIRRRVEDSERAKISSSTTSSYIDEKADERSHQSDERDKQQSDFAARQKNEARSRGNDNDSKQSPVSAIAEAARGDLETTILEDIESNYGLDFLGSDEQVQYIGHSMWGVRIKLTHEDRLGNSTISLITDRGVRLVISDEEGSWDDIIVGHDKIRDIKYNKGVRKESITITTDQYQLNVEDLEIGWSLPESSPPTLQSPSIKFRLRASAHSGSSIEDIVSYVESRIEQLPLENKYDELVNQVSGLDHKEISVPSPHSVDSAEKYEEKYDNLDNLEGIITAEKLEEKYDNLEGIIKKWKVAETKFNEVQDYRSKLIDQISEDNREAWMQSIPSTDTPKEFDTADDAISEYTSLQEEFEELESAINEISVISEHDSLISKYTPERPESEPSPVLEQVTTTVERELNSQQDMSEVKKDLKRIADILTVSSRLADEGGDLPIEPFLQQIIEHLQDDGIPETEELQEWQDLIQKVEKISTFMNDVDLSHPSIDAEHWEESLEMAIEEQYVNILSPIVDQVEKMESGMWELDDLHQISWQEFESLIGTLYESFGYETEVTSDTADMGIDVWAKNSDERVAIQAKRYQEGNTVGRETLQKLASTLAKGDADRVIVVTTSEFARTAKEYSDSFGSEIELIDGEELRDQLNNSDIPPIN